VAVELDLRIETARTADAGILAFLTIIKGLRILRLIRLVRTYKGLRLLIDSLIAILPSIFKVSSLTLLMFFIFAVIGMNMFSGVIQTGTINEHTNFASF